MAKEYDVIVIGAGNGGLATALTCQNAGKKVAIFEKHNIPGGCGTIFRRGKYEFEVALHQLNGMGPKENPGPVRKLFREYGIEDEIDFIRIHSLYSIKLPLDNKIGTVTLPTDRYEAAILLKKIFPNETKIDAYYDMIWQFAKEINDFKKAGENNKRTKEPGSFSKLLIKKVFPLKYKTLAKYGVMPCEEVLDEFFKCQEIKLILSAYWCFMGMPPKKFPFLILALCTYDYITDKPWYVKGGSQAMSTAMAERIKTLGGDVFLNNKVKKIIVENGIAKGIIDQNDEIYYAKKIVSNIAPYVTYNSLIGKENVSEECIDYFRSYTVGISAFIMFLGLDCTPEEVGFTDSFNLIYDSLDANNDFNMSKTLDGSKDPIVATCYTIDDPSVSPEGSSVVSCGCLKYAEEWEKLSPEEYYSKKNELANQILIRLEKRFPNLRSHIEKLDIASPLTFERYLGHPGGAIYGFEQDLKSSVFFNPTKSFIKNLTFSSGWVNTCGFGPNYLNGDKVGKQILKEIE